MEKSIKEIDNIIKDKLINYEEDPSPKFWSRLNGRLARPRILSALIFIVILMSGLLYYMLMPELDAEIVAEQISINTITNIIEQQENDQKIVNSLSEKQKVSEKVITQSSIRDQENTNIENEQTGVTKGIVENDKKTLIVESESEGQVDEIILNDGSRINLIVPKSISNITYDDKNQNQFSKKEIEFGSNSLVNNTYSCSRFSLSLELGRNISWKSLSGDSQYQNFIDYREANEEIIANTVFGMKFNYHLKNWVFSTGLNYTTIGEKINYNINETVVDPDGGYFNVDTLWASIYDQHGNWVPMIIGYNKTWVEEYKNENYTIENINTYSYFEIPVLIGYSFHKGNFTVRPSVGLSLGLLFSASGKLPNINPPEFSELSNESNYLKPVIGNLIFDLSLEYLLNENYGIFIKPFYNKGLNSIYQNYPLSGNYNNAGIKIGVNICIQ